MGHPLARNGAALAPFRANGAHPSYSVPSTLAIAQARSMYPHPPIVGARACSCKHVASSLALRYALSSGEVLVLDFFYVVAQRCD